MRDSERINETVETIDMLIVSAIEQLKKKKKKRSDEHPILEYLQKKGNSINQQTSITIGSLNKSGITINKPSSGKQKFF